VDLPQQRSLQLIGMKLLVDAVILSCNPSLRGIPDLVMVGDG